MSEKKVLSKKMKLFGLMTISSVVCLLNSWRVEPIEAARVTGSHIGTFDGSTTFVTTSSNGIDPGLFIEVVDDEGNLTQYESEEGIIAIPDTKEGAYVTQAKLLGKTKYHDQDTGEVLDQFEEGRNLKLVSSQNPELKMVGENLINPEECLINYSLNVNDGTVRPGSYMNNYYVTGFMEVVSGQTYYRYQDASECVFYDKDKNYVGVATGRTFVIPSNVKYIRGMGLTSRLGVSEYISLSDKAVDFQAHQSSALTVNEDVVLRGIGDARDELDLITGELTKKLLESPNFATDDFLGWVEHDGSWSNDASVYKVSFKLPNSCEDIVWGATNVSTHLAQNITIRGDENWYNPDRGTYASCRHGQLFLHIVKDENGKPNTKEALREYLVTNDIKVVFPLQSPVVEAVNLASDYYFQAITNQNIQVNGEIEPLVVSITVPTDALSFTLDPNQEAGQQFIAPDFTLINETLAPLQIELKNFEQATNVLNDVLPEAYENWEGLNKKESRDIALALVPTPSDGWLTLHEGPRYVVNTSDELIGTVKGKSTVEFSFAALHGRAFSEVLNPQYRLTFVFGFVR